MIGRLFNSEFLFSSDTATHQFWFGFYTAMIPSAFIGLLVGFLVVYFWRKSLKRKLRENENEDR